VLLWQRKTIRDNFLKALQKANRNIEVYKQDLKFRLAGDSSLYKFVYDWQDSEVCGIELFQQIEVPDPPNQLMFEWGY